TSANTNACTFTVTVNDTENPVITACPADIVRSTDAEVCNAVVSFTPPTASDNCPGATVSCSPTNGATFPKGVTTVTCTATDASGNTNACTFTVTVNDTEAPHAVCPANIVVSTTPGSCASNVTFFAAATANCPSTVAG